MIQERGRAKAIENVKGFSGGDIQSFDLGNERVTIRARRDSGLLPWRRRYTVDRFGSRRQEERIIDNEIYPSMRTALAAARERVTGQTQQERKMRRN